MINMMANRIAVQIKRTAPDHPASIAVLRYSIALLLNAVLIITLTLLLSAFTGRTHEVLIILVSFALLRQVSGGIHLNSGMKCVLATTALFTMLSLIELSAFYMVILNVIAAMLCLLFAPSRIQQQTRIPVQYYPLLKWISVLIVCSNFLIMSPVLSLSFAAQSMLLIKLRR
ncbi:MULTISPECIES: accessory gene regulator ArgB-like protein [Paenibacillus]|uniref:Accessory regulator AgrB n=1 Tax=Paenibacillus woosongensis TaxID=307580 RepID=A0A7X3CPJ3_9BACL|nr:accessory gene regulator B family protein [Paenibacillus woosongensis]MUG47425.1 accessory regulator AgrB [Paenibacillus woosongensis]